MELKEEGLRTWAVVQHWLKSHILEAESLQPNDQLGNHTNECTVQWNPALRTPA